VSEKIELVEGVLEFHQVDDFADIHNVEVKLEYRGKGFGDKLMGLFLTEMENRGVTVVTLEVRACNVVAISLYEKFGFKRVAVRKGYYKGGCDGLLMRLEVSL